MTSSLSRPPISVLCFVLFLFTPGILKYVSLLFLRPQKSHYRLESMRVNTTKLKLNSFSQSSFIKLFSGVLTDICHFPLFPVLSGLGIPPVFLTICFPSFSVMALLTQLAKMLCFILFSSFCSRVFDSRPLLQLTLLGWCQWCLGVPSSEHHTWLLARKRL